MYFYKNLFLLFLSLGMILGISSCNKEDFSKGQTDERHIFNEENGKIEKSVSLDLEEVTLQIGDTLKLTPKFGDGQAPLKYYFWDTDSKNIIKILPVDDDFSARVVGKFAGVATVTIFSFDKLKKASCIIHVEDPYDDGVYRVLTIGNDYSKDAVEQYLHDIAEASGKEVIIGSLSQTGASLDDHWENASNDNAVYDFKIIEQDGTVKDQPNTSIKKALSENGWNYISFQQESQESGKYETYTESFPKLYDYVKEHAKNPNAQFVFHQTWAYQSSYNGIEFSDYNKDQMAMYNAIVNAVWEGIKLRPINKVIPVGTAIQNGRATRLGDVFNIDGSRLNALGQYVASCTWFESIFGEGIIGNPFEPNGLTSEEIEIAQHIAHAAIEKPKEVTVLEDYKPIRGIKNDPVFIGFGSENISSYPGWNAFEGDGRYGGGSKINELVDYDRNNTNIPIEIIEAFNGRNDAGKGNVSVFGMSIPNDISTHSYYGNAGDTWQGKDVPESKLRISKLDKSTEYDFCFYASRNGAGDNRETQFTVEGESSKTVYLNASNNGTETICAENIKPNNKGEIIITITAGPNNNNGYGFFYLNTMKISKSN